MTNNDPQSTQSRLAALNQDVLAVSGRQPTQAQPHVNVDIRVEEGAPQMHQQPQQHAQPQATQQVYAQPQTMQMPAYQQPPQQQHQGGYPPNMMPPQGPTSGQAPAKTGALWAVIVLLVAALGALGYGAYLGHERLMALEGAGNNSGLEEKLVALDARLADLEAQISEAASSSKGGIPQASLVAINGKIRKLNDGLQSLKKTVAANETGVKANKSSIASAQASINSLNGLRGKISALQADLTTTNARIDKLAAEQSKLGKNQAKIAEIEKKLVKHANDVRQIYRLIESFQ